MIPAFSSLGTTPPLIFQKEKVPSPCFELNQDGQEQRALFPESQDQYMYGMLVLSPPSRLTVMRAKLVAFGKASVHLEKGM